MKKYDIPVTYIDDHEVEIMKGSEFVDNEAHVRQFETGATRDTDKNKLDYEGFLSPIVLRKYAEYLHKHRIQTDGSYRESDNWQRGIPLDTYMKSGFRHFMDWWLEHRGYGSREDIEDAICGLIFNAMGYLFEILKREKDEAV